MFESVSADTIAMYADGKTPGNATTEHQNPCTRLVVQFVEVRP